MLVDVHPDVEFVDIAQDDQGLVPDQAGILAGADVHLEDLAVDQGPHDSRSILILMLSTWLCACSAAARVHRLVFLPGES